MLRTGREDSPETSDDVVTEKQNKMRATTVDVLLFQLTLFLQVRTCEEDDNDQGVN